MIGPVVIDVHNHLGEPWGTTYEQTPEVLLRKMDRAGVDRAVVFPFPFGNFDNEYVARAVRQHADRLTGFVMVSPFQRVDLRDYIRRYVEDDGYRGIKLHPAAHGYKLSELNVCGPILDVARELGIPVLAYSGDEVYAGPFQVMIAAEAYPEVSFVMAHSGFMMQTNDAVIVAERCPNVLLEHSSGISLGVTQSIKAIGPERVVLGSDTPHMDFEVEIYKMEIAVPDPDARALVLGGNAARLLA